MKTARWFRLVGILSVIVVLAVFVPIGAAQAATSPRPISDFVSQQGTYCISDGSGGCFLFVPPVPNYQGWGDPVHQRGSLIDYAGVANAWITQASGGTRSFGTQTTGTVIERTLPDGRADVEVQLSTTNALTYVLDCPSILLIGCDFASAPLLFGHRAQEVLAGQNASLGRSFFKIRFKNTAPGAPLPDLIQLFNDPSPGQQLESYAFSAQALGTLANGTPGQTSTIQTGNAVRTNIQAALIGLQAMGP
jgi:hypothetical protein